jgi:hypothetical protein
MAMRSDLKHYIVAAFLALTFLLLTSDSATAQGGSGRGGGGNDDSGVSVEFTAEISFSVGDRDQIRAYYSSNPSPGLEALPPGIRKNLARGKPLPPGIAKRFRPDTLRSSLSIPRRYEVIEVGWDVFLVEAATGIIHDVLMDVIR